MPEDLLSRLSSEIDDRPAELRPAIEAAELAKVTDIKLTTARTTLSSLVKAGEVTKDDVGGISGYHLSNH